MGKLSKLILIFALLMAVLTVNVSAAVTDTYVYDKDGKTQPAPSPAQATYAIKGEDLGIGSFNKPQDLCFSDSGAMYIADTENNRIVVIDNVGQTEQSVKIIDRFISDGKTDGFNTPSGIFVDSQGNLFVSDTNNARVVKLSPQGELLQLFVLLMMRFCRKTLYLSRLN